MSKVLRSKSEEALTAHEAVLRAFSYFARLTSEEHATVRRILERALRESPDHADSWAMLAMMYIVEYSDSYNALPNPLERALAAAQRAVDLAPSHVRGYYSLAWVYFFRKEKASRHSRRAGRLAQPHGWFRHRAPRIAVAPCRRVGARSSDGRKGHATESELSRSAALRRLLSRLLSG